MANNDTPDAMSAPHVTVAGPGRLSVKRDTESHDEAKVTHYEVRTSRAWPKSIRMTSDPMEIDGVPGDQVQTHGMNGEIPGPWSASGVAEVEAEEVVDPVVPPAVPSPQPTGDDPMPQSPFENPAYFSSPKIRTWRNAVPSDDLVPDATIGVAIRADAEGTIAWVDDQGETVQMTFMPGEIVYSSVAGVRASGTSVESVHVAYV